MLTSLEIENFKGIAARQRIEFAPLTLLFGANSAGKSSILQALLYLHDLMEHGSADVDRTALGGEGASLGGFARLVHRHDVNRKTSIRVEFSTPNTLAAVPFALAEHLFENLDDRITSAWVEVICAFRNSTAHRGAVVDEVIFGVNGNPRPVVRLRAGLTLREGESNWAWVDTGHPLLTEAAFSRKPAGEWEDEYDDYYQDLPEDDEELQHALRQDWDQFIARCAAAAVDPRTTGVFEGRDEPKAGQQFVFALQRNRLGALPASLEALELVPEDGEHVAAWVRRAFGAVARDPGTDPETAEVRSPFKQGYDQAEEVLSRAANRRVVAELLATLVSGPLRRLHELLRQVVYLGPIRSVPNGGELLGSARGTASWADGLAAWNALKIDRLDLVERVNEWLWRLGAGCSVAVQELIDPDASAEEVATEHEDKVVRRLVLIGQGGVRVFPAEVGSGIAQVLPIIIGCLRRQHTLLLAEQPELHVHPALQVGLGDLMIEAAAVPNSRTRIIAETHSEHLILRVKRRIRETTDGEMGEGTQPFTADQLAVVYVESTAEGVRFRRLRVDQQGEFLDPWPRGFFAERMRELL